MGNIGITIGAQGVKDLTSKFFGFTPQNALKDPEIQKLYLQSLEEHQSGDLKGSFEKLVARYAKFGIGLDVVEKLFNKGLESQKEAKKKQAFKDFGANLAEESSATGDPAVPTISSLFNLAGKVGPKAALGPGGAAGLRPDPITALQAQQRQTSISRQRLVDEQLGVLQSEREAKLKNLEQRTATSKQRETSLANLFDTTNRAVTRSPQRVSTFDVQTARADLETFMSKNENDLVKKTDEQIIAEINKVLNPRGLMLREGFEIKRKSDFLGFGKDFNKDEILNAIVKVPQVTVRESKKVRGLTGAGQPSDREILKNILRERLLFGSSGP